MSMAFIFNVREGMGREMNRLLYQHASMPFSGVGATT